MAHYEPKIEDHTAENLAAKKVADEEAE